MTLLIHDLILDGVFDLACIRETWVGERDDVNLFLLCPLGFGVQHVPWAQGQGGFPRQYGW